MLKPHQLPADVYPDAMAQEEVVQTQYALPRL